MPQTAPTDSVSPQGNLAAFGLTSDSRGGFTKSFVEHCVIIGLVNVRADLTYQQGINRMFSRQTRWDFYWPALAHLGEQTILNKEIYAQGTAMIRKFSVIKRDGQNIVMPILRLLVSSVPVMLLRLMRGIWPRSSPRCRRYRIRLLRRPLRCLVFLRFRVDRIL